jgi:hypothetical protein
MSSQLAAPEAGATQHESLTLSSLPRALQCEVFARLPVDARARAAAVCKAWRDALLERSLWTCLDLSPAGGVPRERVTNALLFGAAAKARGSLTVLDACDCATLSLEAQLHVLAANAGALTVLRRRFLDLAVPADHIEALLGAAPLLRVFDVDLGHAASALARRMLRNEPPFGPLRVHRLGVMAPWPGGEADVRALAADLTASASSVSDLVLRHVPLDGPDTLDAVVDAVLARRLHGLVLGSSVLSQASVPALVRLLGSSALSMLAVLQRGGAEPFFLSGADGAAARLAAALRANNTLTELCLSGARMWHDAAAAETLLASLVAHPSVRDLNLHLNRVAAADRACAGASLGALVAANAPALQKLDVSTCTLGDEGLGPLVDALAANTYLRELDCAVNDMSDAFAFHRLLPAVGANTSLRCLKLLRDDGEPSPGLRFIERMVAARA